MVGDRGGGSLDEAASRTMAFLLSQDLAHQYNLFGGQGKRTFRDLRLFDVVYGKFEFSIVQCNHFLDWSLLYGI